MQESFGWMWTFCSPRRRGNKQAAKEKQYVSILYLNPGKHTIVIKRQTQKISNHGNVLCTNTGITDVTWNIAAIPSQNESVVSLKRMRISELENERMRLTCCVLPQGNALYVCMWFCMKCIFHIAHSGHWP